MRFYSDFPGPRTRQVVGDVVALGLIGMWVWFGVTVFTMVNGLAAFGVQMEQAGSGFRETMEDVGENLGGIPLIGGGIRGPFDGASEAGAALEQAGRDQQEAVLNLALTLGIGVTVLPILMILLVWLVPRIRFVRRANRATAAVGSPAGLDLLALRALATSKLSAVTAIDADALGAWRRGDERVVRELAQLELRSAGVRLREPSSSVTAGGVG